MGNETGGSLLATQQNTTNNTTNNTTIITTIINDYYQTNYSHGIV